MSCPSCWQTLDLAGPATVETPKARTTLPRAWNGKALVAVLIGALALLSATIALVLFCFSGGDHDARQQIARGYSEPSQAGQAFPPPHQAPEVQASAPLSDEQTADAGAASERLPHEEAATTDTFVMPPELPDPPALTPVAEAPVVPTTAPVQTPVADAPQAQEAQAEVAQGNLLINGSFEEGEEPGDFLPLDPGSTAIMGWTVTRGQIDYIGTFWTAADGSRSLDLNGSPGAGGVAQTFATTPGRRYRVTFSLAGNPGGDLTLMRLAVSAAGQTQEFDFDTAGRTQEDLGWTDTTWEFVAVADQTTLELYSIDMSDPIRGPTLDNVSVVALP
jgi:choice-of-anchor C domain-containing protein